ncbi:hypothetical protein GGR56DRAFT_612331, partial [Xylariaceae sp. FL0804]
MFAGGMRRWWWWWGGGKDGRTAMYNTGKTVRLPLPPRSDRRQPACREGGGGGTDEELCGKQARGPGAIVVVWTKSTASSRSEVRVRGAGPRFAPVDPDGRGASQCCSSYRCYYFMGRRSLFLPLLYSLSPLLCSVPRRPCQQPGLFLWKGGNGGSEWACGAPREAAIGRCVSLGVLAGGGRFNIQYCGSQRRGPAVLSPCRQQSQDCLNGKGDECRRWPCMGQVGVSVLLVVVAVVVVLLLLLLLGRTRCEICRPACRGGDRRRVSLEEAM